MRAIAAIVVVSLVAVASAGTAPASWKGSSGSWPPKGSTSVAQLSPRNPIPPVTDKVDSRASGTFVATLDEQFRTLTFQLWYVSSNIFIAQSA